MNLTSYSSRTGEDPNPNSSWGMLVENNKLRELPPNATGELEELINKHPELEPVDTSFISRAAVLLNPLLYFRAYNAWRVKRWIQKRNCNFAYVQIGPSGVLLDYFRVNYSLQQHQ